MEAPLLCKKRDGAVMRFIGELKEEGRRLGYVAGPMVAVSLSQYAVQVISSMMVGHLGELALSSAAIATSLTGVTGLSLLRYVDLLEAREATVLLGDNGSGSLNSKGDKRQ